MQDIKDYLRRYIPARKYVEFCFRELDRAEDIWVRSPKLDGMPRGSGVGGLDDQVARIEMIRKRAEKARADVLTMLEEIEGLIDTLSDFDQKMVVKLRYIDGLTWEEVAQGMNYSLRTIHYIHGKALSELRKHEQEVMG